MEGHIGNAWQQIYLLQTEGNSPNIRDLGPINKPYSIIPCVLTVHCLGFWKDTVTELAQLYACIPYYSLFSNASIRYFVFLVLFDSF